MPQREKRSVSLPPDLSRRIARQASRDGTTFSAWLADAASRRLKLENARRLLAEYEKEYGAFTPEERAEGVARARASLRRPVRRARRSA